MFFTEIEDLDDDILDLLEELELSELEIVGGDRMVMTKIEERED